MVKRKKPAWSLVTTISSWHLLEPVGLNVQREVLAHFWRRSWLSCWLLAAVTPVAVMLQSISQCYKGLRSGDDSGWDSVFTSGQLRPQQLSVAWWRDVLSWWTGASLHVTTDFTAPSLQHMTVTQEISVAFVSEWPQVINTSFTKMASSCSSCWTSSVIFCFGAFPCKIFCWS